MIDIHALRIAIVRIEERVEQIEGFAKECAEKGDYSGAATHQRFSVDLHCAVDIIKGKHVCGIKDFSFHYGDVCERCEIDAALAADQDTEVDQLEHARQLERELELMKLALAIAILWALTNEGGYSVTTKKYYDWANSIKDGIPGNPTNEDVLDAAINVRVGEG